VTIGDLTRFQYFHLYRRVWFVAIPLLIVLISLSILSLMAMFVPGETNGAITIAGFILTTFWCLVMVLLPYRSAKKSFTARAFREPVSYSFTPEETRITSAIGSSQISWSAWTAVRETSTLYLLYYAPNLAMLVPKRFFADRSQIAEWEGLVESRIAPIRIWRPGIAGQWL